MQMRSRIVAVAYALWLFFGLVVFWQVRNNQNAQEISLALGIVPAVLQFFLLGVDPRGLSAPVKLSLALLSLISFSYLSAAGNVADWDPVFEVCNLIFVLAVATMVAGSPDRSLLAKIAVTYSTITGLLLIYVNLRGHYVWGRLSDHMEPNWWGLIGLSVAAAALGARRIFPFGLFGVGTGLLTMYDASARGSIVGFLCAVLVLALISAKGVRGGALVRALVLSVCAIGVTMVLSPYLPHFATLIADNVFKANDPYRGLDSGLSGREFVWAAAIDMWRTHPLLGAGWHQQDTLMHMGTHNSYLAALVDLGIVGLIFYVSFLAWSLISGLSLADTRARRLVVGVLCAYIGLGFFEARAFSVGQPLSLLFYMCAFFALAFRSQNSVIRLLKKQQIA
jgi:O-antigen ligase